MRLTNAWATVTSQNVVLRLVILVLSGLLALVTFVAAKVSMKNPIVIERACYSSVLEPRSNSHTPVEIEAFIKEAVHERFDTDATANAELFSVDEYNLRVKEQEELKNRQMHQRVLVNSVVKNGDSLAIDADRIISVGSIRSAFPFALTANISIVTRSQSNPYGLVLVKALPQNLGGTNDKK